MIQVAALAYAFLVMFVMQSALANRRAGRADGTAILFTGRLLMAASFTLGWGMIVLLMLSHAGVMPAPVLPQV